MQDAVIKFLIQTEAVGWKASDWNLERPDWTGRMRLVREGKELKDSNLLKGNCGKWSKNQA